MAIIAGRKDALHIPLTVPSVREPVNVKSSASWKTLRWNCGSLTQRSVCYWFRGLDALSKKAKAPTIDLPIESVSLSLQDLIGYFHPPDEHLEHEDKQNRLRALKNRQNLFQEEVRSHPSIFCCSLGKMTSQWGKLLSTSLYIPVESNKGSSVQRSRLGRKPLITFISVSLPGKGHLILPSTLTGPCLTLQKHAAGWTPVEVVPCYSVLSALSLSETWL